MLGALGALGLRPPVAPMQGPNVAARERGRDRGPRSLADMTMSGSYRLIVTDTSPLFTLVLADSLDVLLRPGLFVSIPDAVYIEATRVRGAPGADRIVEWINDHLETVRIIPTDVDIDQQRRLEEGRSNSRAWRASRDRGAGTISPF